jgi:predicted dehydrogenase
MDQISRRTFMKRSVAVGAAISASSYSRVMGANEEIRAAVVGFRGRGRNHIESFNDKGKGCRVVALCDIDSKILNKELGKVKRDSPDAKGYADYRIMLEDKNIDVVGIATPEHQHVPVGAWAMRAGKDIYIEKPMTHTMAEGRYMVNMAKKYNRMVQHGTQNRSGAGVTEAISLIQEGKFGKCRVAKAINCQERGPIGRKPDIATPAHINYDLWLGPAPVRSFNENRYHYKWHWFWDYGSGDCGNDGSHQIDIARWGLGVGLPKAITCSGGQLWYDDDHETPDTQMATFEYDEGHIVYEMRLWTDYKQEGHDNGNIFYCDEGWVSIGRGGWKAFDKDGKKVAGGGKGHEDNFGTFLKAVRSRKYSDLTANVLESHHTSFLCHGANVAMRAGMRLIVDPKTEKFVGPGSAEANKLGTKEYRKGFELPEWDTMS